MRSNSHAQFVNTVFRIVFKKYEIQGTKKVKLCYMNSLTFFVLTPWSARFQHIANSCVDNKFVLNYLEFLQEARSVFLEVPW